MTVIDQIYQEDRSPNPAGHPRILALANQKGGVGKTTTAINLGTALAAIGEQVLLIDLDPQGNASTALDVDHHVGVPSVYDVLVDNRPLAEEMKDANDQLAARIVGALNPRRPQELV